MGRQHKVGLDYFYIDCQMEQNVRLIQAEYGLKGFAVFVKLLQKIYGECGYYCEWNEDVLLLFMAENALSSDNKNLINGIVSACIRRNIFSKKLFQEYDILTSEEIQRKYFNATSRREKVEVKKEYLLFPIDKNIKNVVINSINVDRNQINVDRNTQRREEYISDGGGDYLYIRAREEADRLLNKYWCRIPTPEDIEHVSSLISQFSDTGRSLSEDKVELLEYAFECSSFSNALNWNYIHGVFERLKERNIKNINEAYEFDINRKMRK